MSTDMRVRVCANRIPREGTNLEQTVLCALAQVPNLEDVHSHGAGQGTWDLQSSIGDVKVPSLHY